MTIYKKLFVPGAIGSLLTVLIMTPSCRSAGDLSDAYGNFEATSVFISPDVPGKLLRFVVAEGEYIDSGTLVAIVDTMGFYLKLCDLHAQKNAVESRILNLSARSATLSEQLNTLDVEFKRARRLFEDGAVTEQLMDELKGKKKVLLSQISAVEIQKISIKSEISVLEQKELQMRDQFERCFIRNPVSGTVLEKYAEQYEMSMAGKPLYKIADLSTLELKVYAAGTDLQRIKIGETVRVFVDRDEQTNSEIEGIVSWVSSQAEFTPKIIQTKEERVHLVYAVKILVENDGSLKIGMPGEVVFPELNAE